MTSETIDMEAEIESLNSGLNARGITMLTDCRRLNRASSAANTYIFSCDGQEFVLDPAYGKKRRHEIAGYIDSAAPPDILCTHYHNDHSANNGKVAGKSSRIYYHHRIEPKISYFRTNGTGQILVMARDMDLEGMLKRFKMFPGWLIQMVMWSSRISSRLPAAFLFIVSYMYSFQNIGRIDPGRKKAVYLRHDDMTSVDLNHSKTEGWQVRDGLVALDAPGHTDCHLMFYLTQEKALIAGDALNFLNGNDIQFADIKQVDETLKRMIAFVKAEQVEVLLQGHYYPVFGTEAILNYICDIRDRHKVMFNITSEVIRNAEQPLKFDHLLDQLKAYPDDLPRGLAKIAFPRSTLVFLDVYLLKVLGVLGYVKQGDGSWVLEPLV